MKNFKDSPWKDKLYSRLRAVQIYFGGGAAIVPPPCEHPDCLNRAIWLFATPDNRGLDLCGAHTSAAKKAGAITNTYPVENRAMLIAEKKYTPEAWDLHRHLQSKQARA